MYLNRNMHMQIVMFYRYARLPNVDLPGAQYIQLTHLFFFHLITFKQETN